VAFDEAVRRFTRDWRSGRQLELWKSIVIIIIIIPWP
jgi:hypothetical protein